MDSYQTQENYNPALSRETQGQNDRSAEFIERYRYELDAFLYAGFGRRFFSYIIDLLVLWAATSIVLKPIYELTGIQSMKLWVDYFSVGNILNAVVYFAYFILMTKFFQQTLGKMILGIKVYRKDLLNVKWSDVLFREWVGRIISNTFLGMPYLAVIFTPKHIGVHDYFADTVVVKKKYLHYIKENEGL